MRRGELGLGRAGVARRGLSVRDGPRESASVTRRGAPVPDVRHANRLDSLQLQRYVAGARYLRLRTSDGPAAQGTQTLLFGRRLLAAGQLDRAEREFEIARVLPRPYHPAELGLGEVAERRVARWWKDCDPPLRPMWEQAWGTLRAAGPMTVYRPSAAT